MSESERTLFVAYARQSLSRQGDRGDSASVAEQFRAIESYAERLGGRIVARYSDVDVSGSTESRDGLDRLLAEVKQIKPHAVLIRDVSRLARDTRIFLSLVDTLQRSNIKILSSTESLEDRTISVMISAMAERERLALAGRVAGGVREHARRGKMPGRVAFGYRRIDGVMTIYEPEAALVRQVYAWWTAGESLPRIVERLNTDPIAPRTAFGNFWWRDVVRNMLARPTYAGDVVIAARTDISGRRWPEVIARDAHPAIVARDVWDAAQRRWTHQTPVVREAIVSPFSGLLDCARCGGRLYVFNHRRSDVKPPRAPVERHIVRCASYARSMRDGAHHARPCPGKTGSRELKLVEPVAANAVLSLLDGLRSVEAIRANVEALTMRTPDDGAELDRKRQSELSRRRARLLDAYESSQLELDVWLTRDRALAAEADAIAARLAARPVAPDAERLIRVRDALADLPRGGLDLRALLIELDARIVFDLDELRAAVRVGEHVALLFPGLHGD